VAVAALWSCNPATTRPDFLPLPEAPAGAVDASPRQLVPEIRAWLTGAGQRVAVESVRDGYVETAWHAVEPARPPVKMRVWVDPFTPGASRVIVEVVHRPFVDPSRTPRDLEALVPQGHAGRALGEGLIAAMRKRFGAPRGGA
jgi:hypothetical protein